MITLARSVYAEPPPDGGNGYHVLSITCGRAIGPEYAIDGEPVSAEAFDRALVLLALPSRDRGA